jgi:hypothetical protein
MVEYCLQGLRQIRLFHPLILNQSGIPIWLTETNCGVGLSRENMNVWRGMIIWSDYKL